MEALRKCFVFLICAIGLCGQCFAAQAAYESGNYYVQADEIRVASDRIFVLFEGEFVQVNVLCADEGGVFVPYEEMSRQFVRCPYCGHWYDPDHPEDHTCRGY